MDVIGPSYSPLPSGKELLKALRREGLSGMELLKAHSDIVDKWLKHCFDRIPEQQRSGIALVALGGYGRRDLFPFSDIDIMILYKEGARGWIEEACEYVFYPLWDSKREVGHSARTIKECIGEAKRDFFLLVSFLDARFIAGDKALFQSFRTEIDKSLIKGKQKEFSENCLLHRKRRLEQYGSHTYLLEPNIKDGRGGIRDLHSILWTAKVLFGVKGIRDLGGAGVFTEKECLDIETAYNDLVRTRNWLHMVSSRRNDQLSFEYQLEISRLLGFTANVGTLAVEEFMKGVHRALSTIGSGTDLFFEYVQDQLSPHKGCKESKVLEPGIEVLNGKIVVDDIARIKDSPLLIMKVFYYSAIEGVPLHLRTKKIIRQAATLIDESFRSSKEVSRWFQDAIIMARDPGKLLFTMYLETDILTRYIPEFLHVKALAQYDAYHVNTVDMHLIQTVQEIGFLKSTEGRLFKAIPFVNVLYLAALFHDIGKGYGTSHCKKGGRLAESISKRMGLPPDQRETLRFLIENHLFLADSAVRRDLEDEDFILRCARRIKAPDRLTMLYLLTVADSKATGPNAWNDWKGALVQDLYLKIAHLIEHTHVLDPDRIRAVNWMKEELRRILKDIDPDELNLPEDYLLAFTPEAIKQHLRLKGRLRTQPVILIPEDKGSCWSLLFMAKDRTGLLSRIFGVLALENIQVLAAQIFTLKDGTVVDTLDVIPTVKRDFSEMDWNRLEKGLEKAVAGRLGLPHRLAEKYRPLMGTPGPSSLIGGRSEVTIDNEVSNFYTVIDIVADPKIGLLYSVTRTMAEFGINIYRAMVATMGDRNTLSFYCLDGYGQKILDEELLDELKRAILYATECVS